jgi:hypothetical protein
LSERLHNLRGNVAFLAAVHGYRTNLDAHIAPLADPRAIRHADSDAVNHRLSDCRTKCDTLPHHHTDSHANRYHNPYAYAHGDANHTYIAHPYSDAHTDPDGFRNRNANDAIADIHTNAHANPVSNANTDRRNLYADGNGDPGLSVSHTYKH